MNSIVALPIAAAVPILSPPITAPPMPDPIFDAIDAHKAAYAAISDILDVHTGLERELPREKRQSWVTRFEEQIVEADDQRWIDCERAVTAAWEAEGDAAINLVNVHPTTRAGLIALLKYAITADKDGEMWPTDLFSDDETKKRSWHYFLIENIATALAKRVA